MKLEQEQTMSEEAEKAAQESDRVWTFNDWQAFVEGYDAATAKLRPAPAPDVEKLIDSALDNAITALGQCQKGTARQFLRSALAQARANGRQGR